MVQFDSVIPPRHVAVLCACLLGKEARPVAHRDWLISQQPQPAKRGPISVRRIESYDEMHVGPAGLNGRG